MRRFYTILAAVGGLSLSVGGGNALAGSCGYNGPAPGCAPHYAPPTYVAPPPVYRPAPRPIPRPTRSCHKGNGGYGCDAPVISIPGTKPTIDPVIITTSQPLGHLRSVRFSGSPHVNITRLYGQGQVPDIADAPRAFTSGCRPGSTHYGNASAHQYCGQNPVAVSAPARPVKIAAPVSVQTPAPVPVRAPAPQALSIAPPPPPISNYWQKTSGPTRVDGLPATQIFCRGPVPAPKPIAVQRPVIGVPVPVPTPVYPSCYNPPSRYAAGSVMAGGRHYSRGSRYGSGH